MSETVFYTGAGLDRATALRRDDAWLAQRLRHRSTRIVPVWRGHILVVPGDAPAALTITGDHARGILQMTSDVALLGINGEHAYFAIDVSAHEGPVLTPIMGRGEFVDLRAVGPLMDGREAAMLAYARGLMYWHSRQRFCGDCGSPTDSRHGGHMRECANPACGLKHFPRTDPAVIMMVTRPGPDGGACLLGRQARWPDGMYSTLAGFVDPGESLEEAVVREVHEETGVTVTDVIYQASQPWPFPSSLMVGFRARAETVKITLNEDELDDARWFTRSQIAGFEAKGLRLPRTDSIARFLVDGWLTETD